MPEGDKILVIHRNIEAEENFLRTGKPALYVCTAR